MKSLLTKSHLLTVVAVIMLAFMFTGSAQALVDTNNMYDINTVHTLYLQVDPGDYEAMRFSAGNDNGEPESAVYPALINGVYVHQYWQGWLGQIPSVDPNDFIRVAVRRKSDPSLPSELDPQKFSFKIDISKPGFTPQGQRFGGKKKLSLECGSDNSLITQGIAWSVYNAAGVISGRCNWAKLYLSTDLGETWTYLGLYLNVEEPDEEYLEDHIPGRHDYGFLYKKTEYNGEVKETRETETNPFEFKWYPFDHPTYMTEANTPSDWLTQLPQLVDMNQFIGYAVVENFLGNTDGTIGKGNNYYYYDWATNPTDPCLMDPNYRQPRLYLPWDLDTCLLSATAVPVDFIDDGGHLLWGLILEQKDDRTSFGYHTYRAAYFDRYRTLIDGPLTAANINSIVNTVETAISAAVAIEPYPAGTASTGDFAALRTRIQNRWNFVDGQLNAMVPSPLPFSDGFESGSFSAGWTTQNTDATVITGAKYTGTYGAQLKKTTWMQKLITTKGFTGIHVKYRRQTTGLDAGENIYVEWSTDGTTWNNLETIRVAAFADGLQDKTCSSAADNNDNFRIRFLTNAGQNTEYAWVDDVNVTGTPIPPPGSATSPTPANGAANVSLTQDISWTAGPNTLSHDVYFGVTSPGTFRGNQTATTYDTGTLVNGTTYYWRIDEKGNGGTTTGTVWSFTTIAIRTLTTSSTTGGDVTTPGEGAYNYDHGTVVDLVATADLNYHFVNWSGDTGAIADVNSATTTITMNANYAIQANFAIDTFTLGYTAGANGSLTGNTAQVVDYGTNGTAVTAVPALGYHFVNWSDASTQNPRTDTGVTANIAVTANFAIDTFTVAYTAGANGSITGETAQVVNYGADGTAVTAVPALGYHFVDWSDASTANPRTDTGVTANIAVTANFAIDTFTVAYTAGENGTISGTTPQTVNYGADGTAVTASPALGYHFVDWSDASTQNPRTDLNVTANIAVTANFAIDTFTVAYTAGENGTISGTTPQTVNYGADGTEVTAVPALGYHFVDWSDASTANPRTDLAVTANIAVTANFAIDTFTVTASAGVNGSIDPTSAVVNYNGSQLFTAMPDTGYEVNEWLVDGSGVQAGGTTYTLNDITATHTVAVTFSAIVFSISGYVVEIDGNTPVKDVLMSAGDFNTLTDANGYYELAVDYGWSGVITPEKEGYVFEPISNTYSNVTQSYSDVNYTAALMTFKIAGYVLDSGNSTPISGVSVSAENGGGQWTSKYGTGSSLTDAGGYYEVWVDYNWSGKVTPAKYAYAFEPNGTSYENVSADAAGQDYAGTLLTFKISGHITNECSTPIKDVLVNADNGGGQAMTDANGLYEVWVSYAWSGTVTPEKLHYTFNPVGLIYTGVLADQVEQNYAADNIYDLDCDGFIDLGDVKVMCENWLIIGSPIPGDFDADGTVNFVDLAVFSDVWGD